MNLGVRLAGWQTAVLGFAIGMMASRSFAQITLLNETFEGAFPAGNGWAVRDDNAAGTAAYWNDVDAAFGGEGAQGGNWKGYCAGTGYAGTTANPLYRDSMSAYMEKTIDLTTYSSAQLTFGYKIPSIIRTAGLSRDVLSVLWGDGGVRRVLFSTLSVQAAWRQATINLDEFAGTANKLAFSFFSDASGAAEGAYLDNIRVTAFRPAWDAYEFDDGFAQARPIVNNETQEGRTIHTPGNTDWVRFWVDNPLGARHLWLSAWSSSRTWARAEMWLYRGNGELLAHMEDLEGGFLQAKIEQDPLPPGAYYIRIRELGNDGVVPQYNLSVEWQTVYAPDAYEPDDTSATARPIANGEAQIHSIHVPGDTDWMRFAIGAAGARDFRLQVVHVDPNDVRIWLYRGNGDLVRYVEAEQDDGLAVMAIDALASGSYFIKVKGIGDTTTAESYTLQAEWTPNSEPDAYEPDDTSATARVIANGQTQNRSIHVAGNTDWARFVVPAGGARNVVVETGGDSGDTQMWVYQGRTGAQEGFDDDSGGGRFSRIALNALPAGTHYIKIQENGNNGAIPDYTLRVDWISP